MSKMSFVKHPLSICLTFLLAIFIIFSGLINVMAIAINPINKQTVYVGALTYWTAVSLIFWAIFSALGCITSLWIHFKNPAFKKHAWLSLIAKELFYFSIFMVVGTIVKYVLNESVTYDWTVVLMIASIIAFLVVMRKGNFFKLPLAK